MKYPDITPTCKKVSKTDKENYKPIIKVYERLIHDQVYPYFNKMFSKLHSSFCELFDAHHCPLLMIENCRKFLNVGGHTGAVLTYYSTAFDRITCDLLIVKLNTHGVDKSFLDLIFSNLAEKKEQK